MAAIETRSVSSLKAKTARVSHGYLPRVDFFRTTGKRCRVRFMILAFPFFLNSRFFPYKSH